MNTPVICYAAWGKLNKSRPCVISSEWPYGCQEALLTQGLLTKGHLDLHPGSRMRLSLDAPLARGGAFIFHLLVTSKNFYLCATHRHSSQALTAMRFLEKLSRQSNPTSGLLASLMRDASSSYSDDMHTDAHESDAKIVALQTNLEEVKEVMIKSIDAVLDRGEKLKSWWTRPKP